MTSLCWTACKALIEQQSPPQRKKLLDFLPDSQKAAIQKAPEQKVLFCSLSPDEVLDTIHPSWLLHILQPYTENERGFFLATLAPPLSSQLKKLMAIKKNLPTLTPFGKNFLRREMFELIKKERGEALPKNALPDSKFNILISWDAARISLLSFWLGLYDLAEELRYVIDKQVWQRIEAALSPAEWQAVKNFQTKKERLAFGRIALKDALESPAKLRLTTEQYGMNRLAKALYGEHSSLLWHLMLHMDQKRADFLAKLCTPLAKPELKESLVNQVFGLIPLIAEPTKREAP